VLYAGVVEHSVNVHPDARTAVRSLLLEGFIERFDAEGILRIQSGIFPENAPASPSRNAADSAS